MLTSSSGIVNPRRPHNSTPNLPRNTLVVCKISPLRRSKLLPRQKESFYIQKINKFQAVTGTISAFIALYFSLLSKTRGDPGSEPAVVRRRLSSSPSAGLHASPGSNQHQGEAYKGVASITSRRPRSTLPHRPPFFQGPSPPRILQPR